MGNASNRATEQPTTATGRPEVRETSRAFDLEEVTTSYTATARAARKAAELLISN